ncbi:interferon-induced GTP-binding protein Mx [Xylariaceae sp. FL1019]|nr:interferon-induced GTP-binding protein Mx [Xylariaceae sp. FL1019]
MESSPLGELQTAEQRRILDAITQLRKCGLDTILSLPQLVVCGDQSAGKSSLLTALTDIPFPKNDSLCTRFATEINIRCEPIEKFTVKVIPATSLESTGEEQDTKPFSTSISNLDELAGIVDAAKAAMGVTEEHSGPGSAFSKAVLRIDVQGPSRPHLTLVDIPGLIQSTTKGVTEDDIDTVAEITDYYIQQPRTICLAVISAQNDPANQGILRRVHKFDPTGARTLGIITKPDTLKSGSKSEAGFLGLAKNENVFLQLGWHVITNRAYEESDLTPEQRDLSEKTFFRDSIWRQLTQDRVGVDTLRARLSQLLLEHGKTELPRLNDDVERFLQKDRDELSLLGQPRVTIPDCRMYLSQLSMNCYDICKAGIQGFYEHEFFRFRREEEFSLKSEAATRRLRAVVQFLNHNFARDLRTNGHKYVIKLGRDQSEGDDSSQNGREKNEVHNRALVSTRSEGPVELSRNKAFTWANNQIRKSRGKELVGTFNPNVIAELFWEQSAPWDSIAKSHIEQVLQFCEKFVSDILATNATADVKDRFWRILLAEELRKQRSSAYNELDQLIRDNKDYPLNYNHYFTDNLQKRRAARMKGQLQGALSGPPAITVDMDEVSCEEALATLQSIYRVQRKVFLANVTTQVIERHVMKKLMEIFSPLNIFNLPDDKIQAMVAEPSSTKRQRLILQDRILKLEQGQQVFRYAIGSNTSGSLMSQKS